MAVKQSGKILRIGIMQGGRIIEDRYLRKRETVSVGESPKATFILPFAKLPIPKLFPLFLDKKNHYELAFTNSMTGKISIDGKLLSFDELLSSGKAKRRGKFNAFPLNQKMKGTIKIGEVTIIFHFVQAPPIPAKPKLPASIKGGWIKSIDWAYVTILFFSFVLHAAVLGYASTVPVPKFTKLEMVPERFAKIIVTDMPKFEEKDKGDGEGEGDKKKEEKKPKKKVASKEDGDKKPKKGLTDQERAEAAARRKAEIAKKVAGTGLVALLTAKGPGGNKTMGALSDTLADGARFGSVDDLMAGVSGLGVADSATERGRRSSKGGGPKAKGISKAGISKGGKTGLAGRKETEIKASAKMGALQDVDGSLDSAAIKRVVRRNLPSIKHCYEQELRRNPKLAGKVTIEVTVAVTGAVTNAEVISSSMNNRAVEGCMTKTIRRWRFPRPDDGDVIFVYPFIFEASR